ncbi:Inhibitor of growth protein 5 [Apophysomyces ossiformis]|uniref:Inhibitor of growth protein 5 n=1 Tax=Apophysomyces ossiformis TaxID=679940 RepID=A0A8H7BK25_9FUNG|nr:Inhibitor of growth protein 5 [Apophysomyces ossiformis]
MTGADDIMSYLSDYADKLMETVQVESGRFVQTTEILSDQERRERLGRIGQLLNESLKRGEEKFALAKSTYDMVDRHCTRLDNDLQKFEDEQLIGPGRSLLSQSHKDTADGADIEGRRELRSDQGRGMMVRKERRGRKRKKSRTDQDEMGGSDEMAEGDYLSTEDSRHHAQAYVFFTLQPTVSFDSHPSFCSALSLSDLPVDPNEPVYCYCRQVSYGEMVACDNENVSRCYYEH